MALYKDFAIEGGTVTLNMDMTQAVVHTAGAVWLWDNGGRYAKVSIDNGSPVTNLSEKKKEGGREAISANWGEIVSGGSAVTEDKPQTIKVNLTGDQWLVDMAGEVIDQIHEQSKHGRVVIKRGE